MYEDLKGQAVLITGAGKRTGIGYAIAEKMAACGADVVITDLGGTPRPDSEVATGTAREMREIADDLAGRFAIRTLALEMDVCDRESIRRAVAKVREAFGRLDVLVNNAGASFGVPNAVHTYDEAAWLKTMDVNLHGVFRVSQAFAPWLIATKGRIVNVASRAGKVPPLFNGAYAVAKAGVIMLTKVMAKELAGLGVRVNAVCPGQIMTDLQTWRFGLEARFLGGTPEERERAMCATIPLGRIGSPAEAAALVAFLASNESSYMTGQAINVTGGQLMEL
ncbi:MAG: SDR family NAD(P)-dependent oxidoreductase [Thermodesulfobacteriota bacterium]